MRSVSAWPSRPSARRAGAAAAQAPAPSPARAACCSPCDSAADRALGAAPRPACASTSPCPARQRGDRAGMAPEPETVAALSLHGQRHIVSAVKSGQQRVIWKVRARPAPDALRRRQRVDVARRPGGSRPRQARARRKLADQRGLAGAVRADQRVDLASATSRSTCRWRAPRRSASSGRVPQAGLLIIADRLPDAGRRARRARRCVNRTTNSRIGPEDELPVLGPGGRARSPG